MIRTLAKSGALIFCLAAFAGPAASEGLENDYPTDARVDYVFGCMAANGQTRESMEKCSCSVDQLAAILPYDKYVSASTILSMRQGQGGQRQMAFKSTKAYDDKVADLRRAQAEAEIRCYRGGA
ncbi:hypothetical protein [Methylobacterium gnaphalii]|uniref:Uncharacterized protein n=1 Tax=Methylobacterium gnaphalii TaxID=1010610 RepID=A0A512JFE4_9HYPH|nr:hypothetical protein [Methylobacterium gnaphalii]GEP08659.1 hypothetical protein MGN01_05040 [Methylobacterium gnaphalii]GJD69684.1 hypothetical protein MMMDOFMJ_2621 [Methylobacterium gnaphalii]GLS50876.1 hypothetical protein GCM10007885_37300 [Methylobacterium gnaphalii]